MKEDPQGRADFARRADVGRRALAVLADNDDDETQATDLISDVMTHVFGDPRDVQNVRQAEALLARALRSYEGDAEDYDWPREGV